MNDDYLWDRTGEPDPEIQELEAVLGALRYQPQPLSLPARIRERRYFRPMAVAAAIALVVLAVGLWFKISRPAPHGQTETATVRPPAVKETPQADADGSPAHEQLGQFPHRVIRVPHRKLPAASAAVNSANRPPKSTPPREDLSVAQLNEARAAKEQLLQALRLASAKLGLAQRKTQGPPSTIRNQHKVG